MRKSGAQEKPASKINDAYRAGMVHGRENNYAPPLWMLKNPQESLWITAYQNGFREGLKVYRAALAGGVK